MSTFSFTNRRRAKDSVMVLADKRQTAGVIVFCRDGLVYLNFNENVIGDELKSQLDTLLHFAEESTESIEELLQLDRITELYRGDGVVKFKV